MSWISDQTYFNPCSPRGEHQPITQLVRQRKRFQSMLPARGASEGTSITSVIGKFQSMLPARGASNELLAIAVVTYYFNPCSPRGEHHLDFLSAMYAALFQSMLPARGASCANTDPEKTVCISIHAPREGSILCSATIRSNCANFNPCSPRGEHQVVTRRFRRATMNFNPCSPRGEHRLDGIRAGR